MSDVIVTDRLTKYYDGRPVVDGLNLRVAAGDGLRVSGPQRGGQVDDDQDAAGHGPRRTAAGPKLLGEDVRRLRPETRRGSPIWPRGIRCTAG